MSETGVRDPKLIYPPWTEEQVNALNAWQEAGIVHPFTCASRAHSGPSPNIVAEQDGWHCPDCGYVQKWALKSMVEAAISGHWEERIKNGIPLFDFGYTHPVSPDSVTEPPTDGDAKEE